MRERLAALPRGVRLAVVAMVVVPAVLWLFLVWDTRPYSPDEIRADRERVAAARAQTPDPCSNPRRSTQLGQLTLEPICLETRDVPDTYLEREPISLSPDPWDASTLAMLAMAVLSLVVGALWPADRGVRPFLRRAAVVGGGAWLLAAEVGVFWWLGVSWVSQRRGIGFAEFDGPWGFVQGAALLVGLAGLTGVAGRVLLGGAMRGVLSPAGAAFVAGLVLLAVNPVDPWLPHLNVKALLSERVTYTGSEEAEVCQARTDPSLGFEGSEEYCTREVTHSAFDAAGHLAGGVGLLVLAGAATNARPQGRPTIT